MIDFVEMSKMVETGKVKVVKELVSKALEEGASASDILNKGLLPGMNAVGEKFKNNEVYIPEVLISARALNTGVNLLKPLLAAGDVEKPGTAVIGTVHGDLHDIGKNLVKMMLESKGIEVIDLGVDVTADQFISTAKEKGAQIVCCSTLLTTTMPEMENVVKEAQAQGMREDLFIMIGGAPTSDEFCKKIGADCYTQDAASAADAALAWLKEKNA
ncbi:MAG: cobalamin-binding protein [Ruminococcaceae bacterium]|nr:cobalamin-binding protein [Oscillospiraceae bacterium]